MAGRSIAERRFGSVDEFVAWEERQAERHEFFDGNVWPMDAEPAGMAGGTVRHNDLVFNVRSALTAVFRPRGCRVQSENVKLRTESFSAYPDVLVTCTPVDGRETQVADAVVIVEVLSEGTERRDRTVKQQNYFDTPSLLQFVLVSQEAQLVEVYTRSADGWAYRRYRAPDAIVALPSVDARIPMAAIYGGTDVPPYASVVPLRGTEP
ncbi:MAG TPA: Uma2 family endonuclease [Azospirillum sp.]